VVVFQNLAVARSVGCNFWTDEMQCSGKFLDVGADDSPCVFRLSSSLLSVAAGGAEVAQHLGLGRGVASGVCVWRGGLLVASFLYGC
jgi:hypothetical protein